ncbi:6-carboxytetrahydropterin synthase [bacterium]|nr:6-carboxytetrahydropterin synthase [bacterium]
MLTITKTVCFSCSHRLYVKDWDDQKNFEVFGQCSRLHGHNYVLKVSLKGNPDPVTGMIINLTDLNKIIKHEIIKWIDHKNISEQVDVFQTKTPTVENLCIAFWDRLQKALPPNCLYKIALNETENNMAEYTGP